MTKDSSLKAEPNVSANRERESVVYLGNIFKVILKMFSLSRLTSVALLSHKF